jgi:hypothetical protein
VDDSVYACGRSDRNLPSWSCEFDSRHPLQSIGPSQCAFTAPKLFEQGDDKNNQAGHLPFMIIGATYLRALSGGIS